jgi:pimeloyl-ACP methyl ester carboxylesterase
MKVSRTSAPVSLRTDPRSPTLVPRSGFVDAGGVRLHYLDWGDAGQPPLLFLHGGSAHAHWWDFVVPQLADRYRCIALDLRGHGDSGRPPLLDYRLEAHAADVAATIDALDLREVGLVAHSFGAFVAMAYVPHAGNRLSALVIVDSRARLSKRSAHFLEALRKLPQPRYASIDEAVRRFRLLPGANCAHPDVLAHVIRHGLIQKPDGTWTLKFDRRAMAGTPPQDFSPALALVRCPLLAIRGERSEIVTTAGLAEFRAANPRAVTAEIAGAHHHIMLDQPEALAGVIADSLGA